MIENVDKTVRLIRVIPVNSVSSNIKSIIHQIHDAHDPILIVCSPTGSRHLLNDSDKNIWIVQSSRKDRRAMIQTAATKARQLKMTHLLIHEPDHSMETINVKRWLKIVTDNPDAVIIGHRKRTFLALPAIHRIRRWGAILMFRLQTGIELHDPGCPVRVYPLSIWEHLKMRTRQSAFDTEVLVKAAWAGVPIKELPIESQYEISDNRKTFLRHIADMLKKTALNIHWAMRSITPIPHKKVVDDIESKGIKVSVWHPLRSIRALLTENLTPIKLAWAAALGVFLGTLPLIALHTVTILFAAGFFRLNKVAALTASFVCTPPFVPALCIEVGYYLRHGHFLTEISIQTLGYQALERIWEWFLGALFVAPVLAVLVGGMVYGMGLVSRRREGQEGVSDGK